MASSSTLLLGSSTGFVVSSPVSSLPSRKNASVGAPCLAFNAGGFLGKKIGLKGIAAPVKKSEGWAAGVKAQASATTQTTKELERYSLKEDLILAIKDAGGLKGLTDRKADSSARIDVNEKILAVERMNPTPRPTTSPFFEGKWEFLFAGAKSPGLVAAKILLKRFPSELASLTSLVLTIFDGENAKATGTFKILNSVEGSFTLTTKLAVEGPLKLKEEYVEGVFTTPTVPEGSVPTQIKGLVDQISAAVERLPIQVREVISGGVKVPLGNTFSRELLISYLDEDMMIVRDKSGIPDVLVRTEVPATEISIPVVVPEYES
ncbi:hypothetical protein R1flu_015226 [Riccia fluitans]|uniref:Plastid lipid-associated protein/fibrillin conserved domain-containing protein n=1 Tax=Riccia fluitans TaxID=41844 RepID=A0ABD1YIR2_9MARC